jgi:hypothetical protein
MVGTILKQIYVDSALKRGEKLDKIHKSEESQPQPILISWKDYKKTIETQGQQPQQNKKYPKKQRYGKKG